MLHQFSTWQVCEPSLLLINIIVAFDTAPSSPLTAPHFILRYCRADVQYNCQVTFNFGYRPDLQMFWYGKCSGFYPPRFSYHRFEPTISVCQYIIGKLKCPFSFSHKFDVHLYLMTWRVCCIPPPISVRLWKGMGIRLNGQW